jgi:hypothetical protein
MNKGKLPLGLAALVATASLTTAASARTYNITNPNDDNNNCTLRQAVQAANTNLAVGKCAAGEGGSDVINLKSSTAYRLTRGPLVITASLTIKSDVAGTRRTIIGGQHDATLTLRFSTDVNLIDLVLTHETKDGLTSGLVIDGMDSQALLRKVVIKNNNRGILVTNNGKLDTLDVSIHHNTSSGLHGGGIFNSFACDIHIEKTAIYKNTGKLGGGIYNNGNAEIRDSTIAQNTASQQGGGIFMDTGANQTDMKLTTVYKNSAPVGSGFARAGGTILAYRSILSGNTGTDCSGVEPISCESDSAIADPSCDLGVHDDKALFVASDPELSSTTTTASPEKIGFKPKSEDALPRNRGGQPGDEDDPFDQNNKPRKFDPDPNLDDGVDIGALEFN